jgi:hypothetical protein
MLLSYLIVFPLVRGVSTSKEGNQQESNVVIIKSQLYTMFSLPVFLVVPLPYTLAYARVLLTVEMCYLL